MAFWIANVDDTNWRDWVIDRLSTEFPGRDIRIKNDKGTWQNNRFIQLSSILSNRKVHYEYSDGYMYFHVEDYKLRDNVLKDIRRNTRIRNMSNELGWGNSYNVVRGSCWLKNIRIDSIDQLISAFHRISDIFDQPLKEANDKYANFNKNVAYTLPEDFAFQRLTDNPYKDAVCCVKSNLRSVFHSNLVIPDYQRDYCWGRKEIDTLVKSLIEVKDNEPYHLGTIILQDKDNQYNVIDGQQRLTTLTLYLRELGYDDSMPLLKQKFMSRQSKEHIAYAKFILQGLVQRMNINLQEYAKRLADNITFSVLILTEDNLDLAYTFFSNQNSKGVPLSDFDLLKAHHLRYINIDAQAEHLANRWNALVRENNMVYPINALEKTLGTHLFRLRHWLRRNTPDETKARRVKEEYVAAPIMKGIPPFGELFVYSDKIQGGSHFFAYATHFVEIYRDFVKTQQVSLLRQHLCGYSHPIYADVIETLLFAYYLKFNRQYLSEALFCISSIMADHRYSNDRANIKKIRQFACESNLLLMIEQSSSPTFFLAESLNKIKYSGQDLEEADIKNDFYNKLRTMFSCMPDVSDMEIQQRINDEYQL